MWVSLVFTTRKRVYSGCYLFPGTIICEGLSFPPPSALVQFPKKKDFLSLRGFRFSVSLFNQDNQERDYSSFLLYLHGNTFQSHESNMRNT
jgi:hypothetical protein